MTTSIKPVIDGIAASCHRGAETSIYLACSPDVEGVTGTYLTRCRPRFSTTASHDRTAAAQLWESSARMTGLAAD